MDIEKTMEFILEQQAHLTVSMAQTEAQLAQLIANQAKWDERLDVVSTRLDRMEENFQQMSATMFAGFQETRQSIEKLLDVVENSRDFSIKVGRYAKGLENRIERLEKDIKKDLADFDSE